MKLRHVYSFTLALLLFSTTLSLQPKSLHQQLASHGHQSVPARSNQTNGTNGSDSASPEFNQTKALSKSNMAPKEPNQANASNETNKTLAGPTLAKRSNALISAKVNKTMPSNENNNSRPKRNQTKISKTKKTSPKPNQAKATKKSGKSSNKSEKPPPEQNHTNLSFTTDMEQFSGCGAGPPELDDNWLQFKVGDTDRRAKMHLPKGYQNGKTYPVLVSFHGITMDANTMAFMDEYTRFSSHDKENFILVYAEGLDDPRPRQKHSLTRIEKENVFGIPSYLQGTGWRSWNGAGSTGSPGMMGHTCDKGHAPWYKCSTSCGKCSDGCWWSACFDDVGYVKTLLDKLEEKYCVDRSRIFASGFSNGAIFLYELASHAEIANRFAAMVTVSGQPLVGFAHPPASKHIRLLGIWGLEDRIVQNQFTQTLTKNNHTINAALSGEGFYYLPAVDTVGMWTETRGFRSELVNQRFNKSAETHDCRIWAKEWKKLDIVSCTWPGAHEWPNFATEYAISFFFRGDLPNLGDDLFETE